MRTLLLSLLVVFSLSASSQVYFSQPIREEFLKGRVKQVEEFMARFNYEEDWEGKKVEDTTDSVMRSKYLHTLFDYSRFRQRNGKLSSLAEEFIHRVVKHRYLIHYTDTSWTAIVRCNAIVDGKATKIALFFHTQQVAPYEYRWVVYDATSPLYIKQEKKIPHISLSPIEHEIGFTGLLSLSSANFKISKIDDICYQFFNVPGYVFTIERIERKNSYNTGWLITKLIKR